MSVVASFSYYKYTFLVGDILISSMASSKPLVLPTMCQDIVSLLDGCSSRKPCDLHQKIYILRDNLCIALVGDVECMKQFLIELRQRCSYYNEIKEEHIQQFLDDIDCGDISALLLLAKKSGKGKIPLKRWSYGNWRLSKKNMSPNVYAAGSGSEDLIFQMEHASQVEGEFDGRQILAGTIQEAISANMGLLARLIAIERYSLNTVQKYWGGGYEMIYFDGYKFKKLDNVTFVTWLAEINGDGNISITGITLILHYKYWSEGLHIVSIQSKDITSHVVTPIDLIGDCKDEINLTSRDFESTVMGISCVVLTGDGTFFTVDLYAQNIGFKITLTDDKLAIEGEDILEHILYKAISEKICNG